MNRKIKRERLSNRSVESTEAVQFAKVLIIVILIIVGVYFFTRAFITKDLFTDKQATTDDTSEAVTISYSEVTIGTMFNRPEEEYYVILLDSTDSSNSIISAVLANYAEEENSLTVYSVDLNKEVNKSFVSEESNISAKTIDDLKVKDQTLVKIKNGKINSYAEGYDTIKKELGLS